MRPTTTGQRLAPLEALCSTCVDQDDEANLIFTVWCSDSSESPGLKSTSVGLGPVLLCYSVVMSPDTTRPVKLLSEMQLEASEHGEGEVICSNCQHYLFREDGPRFIGRCASRDDLQFAYGACLDFERERS